MKEKLILVTNDDGITAPGITALIKAMMPLGKVVVVAPDAPQSGMGHAITLNKPLRLTQVHLIDGVEMYQCSGTPVDCVKLAKAVVLKTKPDICVSGINHGSNASINVIYSGTMSAAMEASIEGITAIGFSLLDFSIDANFEAAAHYAQLITSTLLNSNAPTGTLLNVNIPKGPLSQIMGMQVCQQAKGKWVENYDERLDPHGKKYYWLKGDFVLEAPHVLADIDALEQNKVSIVPVQYDLTKYSTINDLKLIFPL